MPEQKDVNRLHILLFFLAAARDQISGAVAQASFPSPSGTKESQHL
jgi:hypothetical protein